MQLLSLSLAVVGIERVAVSSSLRSLKSKRTFESRAKRSSINLVDTFSNSLVFFHTVETGYLKSPSYYPGVIARNFE
ncbi:hypothetical protein Tco_0116036 [Tanacetum coccineum]|uniref:Secreted protein n=1 Tax=Tanacetum coccineum TaxID=301880 RepID=A0ABQ4YGE4_9ASTR